MEAINSVFYSIKSKPVGGFIGAVSGYVFCTKIAKTSNLVVIVPMVIISALVGSAVEYKLAENKKIKKWKNRIF